MNKLTAPVIGAITAAVMIVLQLVAFYALHLPLEHNFNFVVYGVFTLGVVAAILNYQHKTEEPAKLKHYFNQGFKAFATVAFIMAIYSFIFFTYNTAFRDTRIAENTQLIIKEGNHTPQEIANNEAQLRKLFMPIMVSSAIFRHLILGALVSLITAGLKSHRPNA